MADYLQESLQSIQATQGEVLRELARLSERSDRELKRLDTVADFIEKQEGRVRELELSTARSDLKWSLLAIIASVAISFGVSSISYSEAKDRREIHPMPPHTYKVDPDKKKDDLGE